MSRHQVYILACLLALCFHSRFPAGSVIGKAFADMAPTYEKNLLFDGQTQYVFTPTQLSAVLPSDWARGAYFEFDLHTSSAVPLEMGIDSASGSMQVAIYGMEGEWSHVTVPLSSNTTDKHAAHDLASLSNRRGDGGWLKLLTSRGSIGTVSKLIFRVKQSAPVAVTVSIKNFSLNSVAEKGSSVPVGVVDQFGQWRSSKNRTSDVSIEQLRSEWDDELRGVSEKRVNFDRYGGYVGRKVAKDGFFRVKIVDGRWWLVDPDGNLFFSIGANSIRPWMGTPTGGREALFQALPPDALEKEYGGAVRPGEVSFHTWNLFRRYGADWYGSWIDTTVKRMDVWGFNTIGAWSDDRLINGKRKPYVVALSGLGMEDGNWGLPNVYDSDYAARLNAAVAKQCDRRRDDPWLIGYFLGNEPAWSGHELDIAAAIVDGKATETKRRLLDHLSVRDTPARRTEFVNKAVGDFVAMATKTIRAHDPNHLLLGVRFGNRVSDAIVRATAEFDVVSINSYGFKVDERRINAVHDIVGKPIMITEFHFGVAGNGLAPGLVAVASQAERGVGYRAYVEGAAALPNVVGVHWFGWVDEPTTGRFDGENFNIGLFDVADRPYLALLEAARETHQRVLALHEGYAKAVGR